MLAYLGEDRHGLRGGVELVLAGRFGVLDQQPWIERLVHAFIGLPNGTS